MEANSNPLIKPRKRYEYKLLNLSDLTHKSNDNHYHELKKAEVKTWVDMLNYFGELGWELKYKPSDMSWVVMREKLD